MQLLKLQLIPFLSYIYFFQINAKVTADLTQFGERIRIEIEPLSEQCERNPPYLAQWDPWGKRVDEVGTLYNM
jgi:hypothetical protein